MLLPEGVAIDGTTGAASPSTGRYEKRLSDLRGFFHDDAALDRAIAEEGDRIAYEVIDYRHEDSDLAFGTTIMMPSRPQTSGKNAAFIVNRVPSSARRFRPRRRASRAQTATMLTRGTGERAASSSKTMWGVLAVMATK